MNALRIEAEEPSPEAIAEALATLRAQFRHEGPIPKGRLRRILLERGLIAEAGVRRLRLAFTLTDAGREWLAEWVRGAGRRPPIMATTRLELVESILLDELCAAAREGSYTLDARRGKILVHLANIDYHLLAVRIVQALKPGEPS